MPHESRRKEDMASEDREKRKNDWSRETEVLVVLVDRKSIPLENTDTDIYW